MKSDLALKYWDAANAIVAFSVLQMLVFLYSLSNKEFREHVEKVYCLVIVAIVVSWALYTIGVVSCYWAERKLRDGENLQFDKALQYTLFARIVIILLYSILGVATLLFGHRHGWA